MSITYLHLITTSEKTEQESERGWQEFRDFKLPLLLPLALIDLVRRKRGERGSRRRSRGARTHLLPEPPHHSQLLRRRWRKEEGGSAQRDTGLRMPAGRFPTEKSTFVLEKNKERTAVLAPRFSALNVVLSLDREAWLPRGGVWECAFLAGELVWLTWGLHLRRATPLPSPKISEMHTSESFSKLETRPEKQQTEVTD